MINEYLFYCKIRYILSPIIIYQKMMKIKIEEPKFNQALWGRKLFRFFICMNFNLLKDKDLNK